MFEILAIVVLVGLNGLLAMSEIAVVSSRRVRLEQAAAQGNHGAQAAMALAESPTRFLSTVQIGITLIGILAGAIGERAIADDIASGLERVPGLARYSDSLATIVVVLLLTYFWLIFGELVPKRLALNHPEAIAAVVAVPMRMLSWLTAPLVHAVSLTTDFCLILIRSRRGEQQEVTHADIRGMIEHGARSGVIHEREQELVERVFRLGELRVASLMIPRTEIDWLEADFTADRVRVAIAASPHSHFPVCQGGLDKLIGVVHVKDLVKHGLLGGTVQLTALARPPVFVPSSTPALMLLERFQETGRHFAFVVDEYGGIEGLITLNDLVESALGEITHADDRDGPMAVERGPNAWVIDGRMAIAGLRKLLNLQTLPREDVADYETIGGMVMAHLGRVPRVGDGFEWEGWRFEVTKMERFRIGHVAVTRPPERRA
jgi:putative hemolysin